MWNNDHKLGTNTLCVCLSWRLRSTFLCVEDPRLQKVVFWLCRIFICLFMLSLIEAANWRFLLLLFHTRHTYISLHLPEGVFVCILWIAFFFLLSLWDFFVPFSQPFHGSLFCTLRGFFFIVAVLWLSRFGANVFCCRHFFHPQNAGFVLAIQVRCLWK